MCEFKVHGTKCAWLIIKHYVCEPTIYIYFLSIIYIKGATLPSRFRTAERVSTLSSWLIGAMLIFGVERGKF